MRRVGAVAFGAYVGTVVAANWMVQHVGDQLTPGAPHTIPVGFGYRAPSGVLAVGVAFTLRDLVQRWLGKWAVIVAVLIGAAVSYFVAPSVAVASAAAFLVSELLDFAVYTPLAERRWLTAVVASNVAGTFVDTFVFLWLAFHSLTYWQGQVIGKLWMTVAAVLMLTPIRMRRGAVALGEQVAS